MSTSVNIYIFKKSFFDNFIDLYAGTVRPCLSDGIRFLTFCWINEVAGLTNHGLEAGSHTHDAHVHMYIKMKHF